MAARLLDGAPKLGHGTHEVDVGRLLAAQQQDLIAVPLVLVEVW
jgi:hypothetical protein